MAYDDLDTLAVGDPVRASYLNQIRDNFEDHEDRITDAETAVGDHETRLDALDGGSVTNPTLQRATVTLTNAEIKALPTTGITLVAAPALNVRAKLISVTYYSYLHAAYTNIDATSASVEVQTSSGARLGGFLADDSAATITKLTTLLTSLSPLTVDLGPYVAADGGVFVLPLVTTGASSVDGAALQFKANNNGTGNFTGGNVSNLLTVVCYYSLETVPAYVMPFARIPDVGRRRPRSPRRRGDGNVTPQL